MARHNRSRFGVNKEIPVKASLATMAVLTILCAAPMPAASQQKSAAGAPKAAPDVPSARPIRRLADGHPDLNGFWASSAGPDTPVGGFGPPDPNVRRGDNGARARLADPNQPPYKPELLEKVKDLARNESKLDPAFFCKPGGIPRIGPPHAIIQAPGMPIVFLYQVIAGNAFRLVPTDGRPHDPEADLSYYGDSVGHWEGDTLVVDSTDFNDDTWLGLDGWFHSTALHVVERITREGDTIRYQATVEDPNVFTRPWAMNPRIAKATTDLIVENAPCVERDEGHIIDYDLKTRPQ
ncbi:MAG: hypothetical protein DMG32_05015 [Acidobacteria bacterium]|nr:MAG: hypothetical protein DMG32_05015 [Acidobacteriota bacterium]